MMLNGVCYMEYLASHLRYNKVSEDDSYIIETDVEAHTPLNINYNSLDTSNNNHSHEYSNIQDTREDSLQHYPTTLSLLKFRTILIGASSILWINVSWTAIEPLLAKRLDSLHVGKKGIGITIFSLSSIIYVPQCLSRAISTTTCSYNIIIDYANTDCSATLRGVKSLPSVFGWDYIAWVRPVWVQLLPWFPDTKQRHLNDTIASIYNISMTLGQLVGYTIGPPLISSYGFTRMTQIVACLIYLQSILFYFGTTKYSRRRKDASRTSSNLSNKQII